MKTLLILRHAKASDDAATDHERPLSARGKQEAQQAGQWLLEQQLLPDIILSSDAKRCRRTVEKVCAASQFRGQTLLSGELYLADPSTYLKALSGLDDHAARVLLVGHNPGLEALLQKLTQRHEPLGTACLANVRLDSLEHWADLSSTTHGELVTVWRPSIIG